MAGKFLITDYGASDNGKLCTDAIQKAIDDCFLNGGGTIVIPGGKFLTGSVRLRSNVSLLLEENSALIGSRDPSDYLGFAEDKIEPVKEEYKTDDIWKSVKERESYDYCKRPAGRWGNAVIRAIDAENISIIGKKNSYIDGADCFDAIGEEHYRGPHAISMFYCRNINLCGFTVKNSANWAHALFWCNNISMKDIEVDAGHDGVHITSCENTDIENCRFFTGDDCVAGIDNINTYVKDCVMNTACSAFRFGGKNMTVIGCKMYGPAKYLFRGSLTDKEKRSGKLSQTGGEHRYNMLSAFTYYSDFSREINETPGNIVFKDCVVESADRFMHYNFSGNEPWQVNKPLESIRFENITASGIKMPLTAYGDNSLRYVCSFRNCDISFDKEYSGNTFMQAAFYKNLSFENVTVGNIGNPVIKTWTDGEITLCNTKLGTIKTVEKFFAQSI